MVSGINNYLPNMNNLGSTGQAGLGALCGSTGTDSSSQGLNSGANSIFGQNASGTNGQGNQQDTVQQLLQLLLALLQQLQGGGAQSPAPGNSSTPASSGGGSSPLGAGGSSGGGSCPTSTGGGSSCPTSTGGGSSCPTSTGGGTSCPTSTGGGGSTPTSTGTSSSSPVSGTSSNILNDGRNMALQYLQGIGDTATLNALKGANIGVANLPEGAGALTQGNRITIDSDELKGGNTNQLTRQVGSLFTHEGTHVNQNKIHGNVPDTKNFEREAYNKQNGFNRQNGLSQINVEKTLNSPLYKGLK